MTENRVLSANQTGINNPAVVREPAKPDFFENHTAAQTINTQAKYNKKAPLVFIPGIMGSRLFKKGSSEPIWPPVGWWDKGHFKPKSLRDLTETTDIEVCRNEPLFPLVYSEFLRYIENMGYILGENFWIFAYDWTQSNRRSGKLLEVFIQTILKAHPQWTEVDVINHSMGGLVTRAAAKLFSAKIRRTVYITSPHFGSPKAYFILHPRIEFSVFGNFFKSVIGDLAWKWYLHKLIDTENNNLEKEITDLARRLDSVYELLPDKYYLDHGHPLVIRKSLKEDIPVLGLESTYYTAQCRFPSPELQDKIRRAMQFKEELGDSLPGKENLVIFSDTEETYDHITYLEKAGWHFGRYGDSGQKGDLLVPVDSATLNNPASSWKVSGTHNGVPNSLETSQVIKAFLEKE
jgi:pimeloyl-ACP methyl ester carboxylesterase